MPDTDDVYCEAWDPATQDAHGVMPESAADERDRAGAQYAVLLQENDHPVALIQVVWIAGYLGVAPICGFPISTASLSPDQRSGSF